MPNHFRAGEVTPTLFTCQECRCGPRNTLSSAISGAAGGFAAGAVAGGLNAAYYGGNVGEGILMGAGMGAASGAVFGGLKGYLGSGDPVDAQTVQAGEVPDTSMMVASDTWTTPQSGIVTEGKASFYHDMFIGRKTISGATFSQELDTGAMHYDKLGFT